MTVSKSFALRTRGGSQTWTAANDRLVDLDANLTEWQEILELAAMLATRCGDAYRKGSDRTRKLFNAAVFERRDVKDGQRKSLARRQQQDADRRASSE